MSNDVNFLASFVFEIHELTRSKLQSKIMMLQIGKSRCGGGRVGLRRRFKAPISSEARVRIPSSAKSFCVTGQHTQDVNFLDVYLFFHFPPTTD
jgi:hypothetical protein